MNNLVTYLTNLLQGDPEGAAAFLALLLLWNIINSMLAMLLKFDIGGIQKMLKKHGIWV